MISDVKIAQKVCKLIADELIWEKFSLDFLAEQLNIPKPLLLKKFSSKRSFLSFLTQLLQKQIDQEIDTDRSNKHDILFDTIMVYLESSKNYKPAIAKIIEHVEYNPRNACDIIPIGISIAEWIYQKIDYEQKTILKLVHTRALALILLKILYAWLNDDSSDLAKTMTVTNEMLLMYNKYLL